MMSQTSGFISRSPLPATFPEVLGAGAVIASRTHSAGQKQGDLAAHVTLDRGLSAARLLPMNPRVYVGPVALMVTVGCVNLKILNSVIRPISIPMMNDFGREKGPAQMPFHQVPMLENPAAPVTCGRIGKDVEPHVTLGVERTSVPSGAMSRKHASAATETCVTGLHSGQRSLECTTAILTLENPRLWNEV
jgi:hypothetical protein